jgi:adenylosuccinate lyase
METWQSGTPFRETMRKHQEAAAIPDAKLDDVMRPDRYLANLVPLFDRLEALS